MAAAEIQVDMQNFRTKYKIVMKIEEINSNKSINKVS